ncbi:MAG: hypothetical protein JWQ13_1015 [Ramlibacter sp.]|jgi:hypothetical protein|nr:hypothetical protein [Ramlibacter sp.]
MKFLWSLFASLLYAVLACLVYYVHIRYFKVDVVLYSAILDALIAAALMTLLLFARREFRLFSRYEKAQLGVIWLLAGCLVALGLPTVIDRSLSFYILEKLQQRGGAIQQARFEEVFTREYVKEHRLVDVRLTEQQVSGTIVIENGCVKLTERGARLAAFSRFFRANLLPRQRLLAGTYSDDLTDPFRKSQSQVDYQCR